MTQKDDNWKPEQRKRIDNKEFIVEVRGDFDDEMELTDVGRLEALENFFKEVAHLTLNHDVLEDHAVVFPSKLGPLLEAVDKEWWKRK